jgi:hypothetical protein
MTFRTFDKTVKRNQITRSSVVFLTINARGKINFSQAARRFFNMEEGDRVLFHQDIDYRSDWFIQFTKELQGYKLVLGETDTRITAALPSQEIFKSIGQQPQKLTFPIMTKPYNNDGRMYYRIDVKNQIK